MRSAATIQDSEDKVTRVAPKKLQASSLYSFQPITPAQEKVWAEYKKGQNLFLHGIAGTGKTFVAIYLAMQEILSRESEYQRVVVVRSCVPVRDIGFMPGTKEEKELVYQLPYEAIMKEIFVPNGTPIMDKLKDQKLYEFVSTSFLRGVTLHRTIVIFDEVQNATMQELDTAMTRLGDDCKIIFCGDFRQSDLQKQNDREGLHKFMQITRSMDEISHVEFHIEDIVRSSLVKSYITTKTRLGLT